MPEGFFVTGTDTNVGKTVLSALLCSTLPATYWKPIQTGAVEGTDRQTVLAASGIGESQAFPEAYIFDDPVSPHLAAQRAGREISVEQIRLPQTGGARLIAEGAGGVMVPINSHEFMTDLIRHLGFPVVLAARSTLGTINHTLLSLRCLESSGARVAGVVLIGPENRDNRQAIERYGETPVIGHIPPLQIIDRQTLRDVFARHFSQEAFA